MKPSTIRQTLMRLLILAIVAGITVFIARAPAPQPVRLLPPPPTSTPAPMRVHVTGAVIAPGVYSLPPGSIAQAALAAAGGPTSQADLTRFNLAAALHDGDQVRVPAIDETPAEAAPAGPGQPLNLNTATVEQLDSLPNIGPVLAQSIVDYREANGPFATLDALLNVPGFGPKTLDGIRDLASVQ